MERRSIIRFRLTNPQGPIAGDDPLNQYSDFAFDLDLDPGEPYRVEQGRVVVRFTDLAIQTVAEGDVSAPPSRNRALARAGHHAIENLRRILALPGAERRQLLTVTQDQTEALLPVDPTRVKFGQWVQIERPSDASPAKVFISCGQQNAKEIQLGSRIAELVKQKTGLEGYFAQNQQTLDGLTGNIFQAIYNAAGFIAVMHRRDLIGNSGEYRGSVWVEQEIAIAAFLVQVLGMSLPAKVYVQKRIRREGVRGFILLNPIEFETSEDVLADLEGWWPSLILPGVAPRPTAGMAPTEEIALIEAIKKHYFQAGEVQSFIRELASLSSQEKRRLHQTVMNVIRREQGRQPKAYPPERLKEMYPES